ncbi:hypothetical protein BDV24DRAFT_170107 [Aspergillus arachidicola]|uniref:CRAL-TRIO domain-containing protein n=1 Tax=Aspergillus arachidicola TaxID=656916 RepID=A0A5N6XQ89_9EURO|nr:hypothetical protein BDV24DRAFT_170107 [Aspergillus arachidicola]
MVLLWRRSLAAQPPLVDEKSASNYRKNSSRPDTETEWMVGQLNHLTLEQESKFLKFQDQCKEYGYSKSQDEDQFVEYERATLLRFLRAQKFDIEKALQQLRDAYKWQTEHDIKSFYQSMDVELYESSRQMFSQWTGRRDTQGLPLYVFPLKNLTKETMEAYVSKMSPFSKTSSWSSEPTSGHLIAFHALYENMLDFVMPFCDRLERPHMEVPVTASTHIIDLDGVTLRQFLDIKRYLQGASLLATKHYPETLGHIFVSPLDDNVRSFLRPVLGNGPDLNKILGAPPIFRTAWEIVKNWVDPGTLSKISILSPSESRQTLLNYIEPSSLPEQYGGTLNWKWGDMPNLDDAGRSLTPSLYQNNGSGHDQFIKGPMIFKQDAIEGLGTIEGKKRRVVIPVNGLRVRA